MADKFILMDLTDERSKKIAEILGNKTCKKIIDYLSEVKEASEKDISDKLSIPINTVEYNLKKLIESGLIEKTKNFFWSVKGRKIDMYRLSNKKILISPRTLVRGIIPALVGVLLVSFGIKVFSDKMNSDIFNSGIDVSRTVGSGASNVVVSSVPPVADKISAVGEYSPVPLVQSAQNICSNAGSFISSEAWAWFLIGGLFVILIFLLWNQFKKVKGGF
jgi:DNA-binding transcriptional ArsR family regulator